MYLASCILLHVGLARIPSRGAPKYAPPPAGAMHRRRFSCEMLCYLLLYNFTCEKPKNPKTSRVRVGDILFLHVPINFNV